MLLLVITILRDLADLALFPFIVSLLGGALWHLLALDSAGWPEDGPPEALLEAVGEEAIDDRIGTAVGIRQHHHEEVDAKEGWLLWQWADNIDYVEDIEGEPAKDEDSHNSHHHAGHSAL